MTGEHTNGNGGGAGPAPKIHEIDYRSVLVPVDGKLRGSRARGLGDVLEDLFHDGYDQVVLDIRNCWSIDSVGALALERSLEIGQRLFLVVGAGFPLDELLTSTKAATRIAVFTDVADAIRQVRSREESGLAVA